MTEVFRVQLVSLYRSPEVVGCTAEPVLHTELVIQGQGTTHEGHQENERGIIMGSVGLLAKHHYVAIDVVSHFEEGQPLRIEDSLKSIRARPPPYIHVEGGGRLFLLHPIEHNRYLLSVTVPKTVWRWFGPTALHVLLSTAVRGYEIGTDVAAVASVPTYYPLHNRISENATAVQDALRTRMQQVVEFTAHLTECISQGTVSSPTISQVSAQVVASVNKMCSCSPSALRHSNQFRVMMQKLVWSATNFSEYTSMNGAIASGGLCDGYKRLVVTASAVWHRGEPVFSCGSCEDFQMYLLPAALTTYMCRCLGEGAQQTITIKCFAMHARTGADCLRVPGYLKQMSQPHHVGATVCLSFASAGGWCIALQMEVALNDFTGAPMSHIVSGVIKLISTTLEAPQFTKLMANKSAETLHCAPSASLFTAAASGVMESVRQIGIYQHYCSNGAYAINILQNTCIYHYCKGDTSHPGETTECRNPWPESLDAAALELVKLTSFSLRYGSGRASRNGSALCAAPRSSSPFTILRTNGAVVAMLVVPLLFPDAAVALLVLELAPSGSTAPAIRAFASWLAAKVM
ncbi:hypothetical protein, conserved [Trypanosoma brucei gambiense DAL972]|uniref:Uncharacterized protein n=2 Tax=Trypanosoma brucei TaxID=5691 RepID=D0A765_TRYB9|nr:hypothetical protein, conserved [Trypanosoma brucei gambiense DAL972]CBH17516.1 hypothetical protein, conserved [Trypanosoma brucei gambiense DAL972]|eukprot:XP_011779780.1 hypothetical protein, conserved [Trypanosoma brucei gambiense DAL972]